MRRKEDFLNKNKNEIIDMVNKIPNEDIEKLLMSIKHEDLDIKEYENLYAGLKIRTWLD
ncbi:MAG: hypothetical protein LBM96_13195 [Methanobrevibacter sp.]|jgi:hypothetical protein|nr:hypothetical protein [Candidatus Methanoflexus mossambicus]